MEYRMKLIATALCTVLFAGLLVQAPVFAKSAAAPVDKDGKQRYIVLLQDPPLAAYDGRILMTPELGTATTRLPATAKSVTGEHRLDVRSSRSRQYLKFLDQRFEHFRGTAALRLGRQLKAVHRYRNAVNGFATDLDASEVQAMRDLQGVEAVLLDQVHRMETDSGPNWIGAEDIYIGNSGFNPTGGEGVVIGIIDSGVDWDHPSFFDPGEGKLPGQGDWDHVNPYGKELGLCSDAEVKCNDKLVGVYDFVEESDSVEGTEENNNGLDNTGHGSHVASTAAGNPRSVNYKGALLNLAGVAPNANIVSYRVCYLGDPDDPDAGGCQGSAILSAIDQAITDKVDVINYSVGTDAFDPWREASSRAYLNARAAGIFVATSAGNEGPNAGSIGSPANAPWITAVGAATHDRVFGSFVRQMSGGDTTPPVELLGASFTDGTGVTKIVHAKDFGNALCGVGDSESGLTCDENTGTSNPFAENTFNGEIVVCDRGGYGRIEKGKNLMLAGAGGYILANTDERAESIVADDHCLPATHIGVTAGDQLRTWLDSGSGHQGSISDWGVLHNDETADEISFFSSRGPNLPPVEDILKPDLIAPGAFILAAYVPDPYAFLWGTSQSAPHVTGGAALIKSVHPDWTPAMIASSLAMTATPELAHDFNGSDATPHKRGSGRPHLDLAVGAALYVNETESGFRAANPSQGGDPKDLNLPGMVDTVCYEGCSFNRTVTDLVGGASWSVAAEGFAEGVSVNVSPRNFTLANGASRLLNIDIDLTGGLVVGTWVYGEIRLRSSGHPDAVFTVAIFADGGPIPSEWTIDSKEISGWQEYSLSGLVAMPDATFTSGGLEIPSLKIEDLPQDPTPGSPYDDSAGLMTLMLEVPPDTLWLHTSTLESTANDLDLYVGLDANNDGIAEPTEELCRSTSPTEIELCDLFTPVAGNYWVIVQNWDAGLDPDEVTLKTAVVVVGKNTLSRLYASGAGIVARGASQNVRLSWDNVGARPETELMGAVGVGTHRETPNNIGVIPVTFTKTDVDDPKTLVLMNGISRGLTVRGSGMHNLADIDIPPGADSLTVTASGEDGEQSENLEIELYRMDFSSAFSEVPFATAPDMSGNPIASATGSNGNGPSVTISGNTLTQGRWYTVLRNNRGVDASAKIRVDVGFTGDPINIDAGLWGSTLRSSDQGFDYGVTGSARAMIWYTYAEDGQPDWYLAAAAHQEGNIWTAELLRFTNDGLSQQATPIGHVSITTLAEDDNIFSWVLYGKNGSERNFPSPSRACPDIDGTKRSYTGLWGREPEGVGGASGLVNRTSQVFIHFLYDDDGNPRWLLAVPDKQSPTEEVATMLQFSGYCAVCDEIPIPDPRSAGTFTRTFADESNLTWTFDYSFLSPLSGTIKRTDEAVKLTLPLDCQ